MKRLGRVAGLLFCAGSALLAQSFSVTPTSAEWRVVQGWAIAPPLSFSVQAPAGWTASVQGADWVSLSASSGTGPATVRASLVGWATLRLTPGAFTARLVFTPAGGQSVTVTVTCTVVPSRPRPRFTYLNGPHHCVQTTGYEDAATCTVPDERPPGNFRPPRLGGSYFDPNFGALLRIVTEPGWNHSYASPSALSAENRYLLVMRAGSWNVVEAMTGKVVRERAPALEGSMWDAVNPAVFYTIRGTRIERYDVAAGSSRVVVDYASGTPALTRILTGASSDTSKDNWISFYAPNEKQVCVVNLAEVRTYCASYDQLGGLTLNPANRGTFVAKGIDRTTRKRYVLLSASPTMAVFSVNLEAGKLDFEYLAPERLDGNGNKDGVCDPGESCFTGDHGDTLEDSEGNQYIVGSLETAAPCSNGIYTFRLNAGEKLLLPVEVGGGARKQTILQNCGGVDTWTDWHLSCAKHAPYCAVSTTYGRFGAVRDPADLTPVRRTAHLSEVMVIKDNATEVRRLAQHRSVQFSTEEARGYWSTPRASISFDGSYVVFDSNFGEPNQPRVVVAETGYGKTQIRELRDAAAFGARLTPGGMASIFGVNLAHCNQAAGSFPLPVTICGTSVMFGETKAPLLFASTSQVNVQVPASLSPLTEYPVTVERGESAADADRTTLAASALAPYAPAVFAYALEDGVRRAVLQNLDIASGRLTLNGPDPALGLEPQRPGMAGVIYANNLGPVSPAVADGTPAPASPLAYTVHPVEVFINGTRQNVLFAGLTPGFSGLYQVNYTLSEATPVLPAEQNRLWLKISEAESDPLAVSLASRQ